MTVSHRVEALRKELKKQTSFDGFLVVHQGEIITHNFPDEETPSQLTPIISEMLDGYREAGRKVESFMMETLSLSLLTVAQPEGWVMVLLPSRPEDPEIIVENILKTMKHHPSFFSKSSSKTPAMKTDSSSAPMKLNIKK